LKGEKMVELLQKGHGGWEDSMAVYSIKYYVIKFVSDLRQVGGFLLLLRFPPPIKLIATI
jgi:hypothetical protein